MAEGLIINPPAPKPGGPASKPPCLRPNGVLPPGGYVCLIDLRTAPGCVCGCCWDVRIPHTQPMYPPQHMAMIAAALAGSMDASEAARRLLVEKFRLPGVDQLFEMMVDRERKRRHGGRIACGYALRMPGEEVKSGQ